MCIALPVKVIAIKNKKAIVEGIDCQKEVGGFLIKVKMGDYVILQNNIIVRKISKREAKETLDLIRK